MFWGFAILNEDLKNAEWGYMSFNELKEIKISSAGIEIDCEVNWKVRKAIEIDKIRKAQGWASMVIKLTAKEVTKKEVRSEDQLSLFY